MSTKYRAGRAVAALALAVAGLAAPTTANAAVAPRPATGVRTHALLHGNTASAGASVARFWTPERLKSARSLDGTKVPNRMPTPAEMRAAATPVVPADSTPIVLPPSMGSARVGVTSTVGRIYFSDSNGTTNTCTGTSVTSQAGDMVLTAGRCVYGGPRMDNSGSQPRNWYYNWIYIPGFWIDSAGNVHEPYGVWAAWTLATISSWVYSADPTQDIGMALVVHNAYGQALTDVVGGQGLTWGLATGQSVTQYGYAADDPSYLRSCTDTIQRTPVAGNDGLIVCLPGPGATGGPWLAFQDSWGMGLIGGVTSYFYFDIPQLPLSPWFSQNVYDMYVSLRTV